MRTICWMLALIFTLSLSGSSRADENPDLYLTKLVVTSAEPTKKGRHRGSVKLRGVTPGYHLPADFQFDPAQTPLGVYVGGVRLFSGPGTGTWRRTSSREWTYREKGERRWKIRLDFSGRSEFVIRGKRIDLREAKGPADCDVFLTFGGAALGIRTTGRERAGGWKWSRGASAMPSKAPGYIPSGGDGNPDDDDPPNPGPADYSILADGNVLFSSPASWQHGLVVTNAGTWAQQWGNLFAGQAPPAVDFGRDQVVLIHARGNLFTVFNVVKTSSGVRIDYRITVVPGVRYYAYRAVSLPRSAGSVTLNPI